MSHEEIVIRKARSTEHQIINILKSVETGRTVKDVCHEAGISEALYYNWKAKYGGMEASDIKKTKDPKDDNRRLKQMVTDLSLECPALKDVIEKCFKTSDKARTRELSDGTIYHEFTPGLQDIIAEQDDVFLSA